MARRHRPGDVETGEKRTLLPFSGSTDITDELSPDGKWIYILVLQTEADIWMVEFEEADPGSRAHHA